MIDWRVCESAAGHASYRVRPGRRSEMYHGPSGPSPWARIRACGTSLFVADPHAANPTGLWKKAPGCWQTSGRQRSQERRIGCRLADEGC
jgi:hypothetical protein